MITAENEIASRTPGEAAAPAGAQGNTPVGPRHGKAPKKPGLSKRTRGIVTAAVIVAVVCAVAFSVWFFLFRDKKDSGAAITEIAQLGSIQSRVEGEGNAMAGASAALTTQANCIIGDVLVNVGDTVYQDQPLYTAKSPDAEEQAAAAERAVEDQKSVIESLKKSVTSANDVLKDAQKALGEATALRSELTVKAPFAGKLTDVTEVTAGADLAGGSTLATLVDDSRMRLTLYFSYAYENDVYVGQPAEVSVPVLMYLTQGVVEEIHKVDFISPEGGKFFEVTLSFVNPHTLTEDMEASATMRTAAGVDIYPYGSGKLKYNNTATIVAKQSGQVTTVGNLRNYATVAAGETLLVQSAKELNKQIESLSNGVKSAREGVEAAEKSVADGEAKLAELEAALVTAQEALGGFDVAAPISGTVTSCTIAPGQEVQGGATVVTIIDTTNMLVEITVDDRNIPFVTPGMTVELTDWNDAMYIGTVTNIDMSASGDGSMGMTRYPVTVSVENYDGTLLQGMWLTYSFVTSEAVDCVTLPIQCVKSIVDDQGEPRTVVFLKSETRPENAVDFTPPEDDYYGTPSYPSESEGFYPVPVETGLSDRYSIEITSGLNAGDEVFSVYEMSGAYA